MSAVRKWLCGCGLFVVTWFFMIVFAPLSCSDCDEREISDEYVELYKKAQTGDLILVQSNDFFSSMIRDIDDCEFAGVKLVYEIAPGEKALIVSDASDLADRTKGLLVKSMMEYFDDYNDLRVALFRPKDGVSKKMLQDMRALSQRALEGNENPIAYDFTFNNSDRTTMTCAKVLLTAFGEDNLLDRKRENHPIFKTTLACDLKLEKIKQITPWIGYWK